jgi:hypothetical protein
VDLLELRKMTIRQREGRLAAKLPAVMAESTAVALPAPPGAEHEAACGPPPEGADVTSARAEATEAFKAGRYEDAIQWCAHRYPSSRATTREGAMELRTLVCQWGERRNLRQVELTSPRLCHQQKRRCVFRRLLHTL